MHFPSPLSSRFIALVILATGLTGSLSSYGASCHGGGGGQTIVVLPSNQNYQVGLATSYRSVEGHFGPTGTYSSNEPGNSTTSKTALFGVGYRLLDDLQVATTLALVSSEHIYPSKSLSYTGMGDPVLEGRYSLWDDVLFMPYRPGVELAAGVRLPVGTSVFDSSDPYGTNIVGDGTYTVHLAATVAKRVSQFRFSVEGTYFFPFAKTVDQMKGKAVAEPYSLKSGNRFQLQEGVTVLLSRQWSASAGMKQLWQGHSTSRGESAPGSAARLFSTNVGAAYSPSESWSLGASFETLAPFYRYAANQPNFQTLAVTASYGAF